MTTLPPEANGEQPVQPEQPLTPPPVQPEQVAGAVPPPAPEQPQYTAPPADAYQAPPAGAYQAAPPGGYQQPGGHAQPGASDPAVSNITLNYWLSVFFSWIPALIFWLIDKDKGNQRATAFHVSNLNFSLLRTGVLVVSWILGVIPYIGWLLAILLWIAHIVLFVFHIMAAVKAAENYRNGGSTDPFIFNIPLIK